LGTRRLSWRDLYVIVKHLPDTSALRREVLGEQGPWGLHGHLLAGIFDLLAVANWQRGGDENAKKPERIERPGVKKQLDGQLLAQGKAVSIEDMNKQLGW
jgi:hypothetical protein